MNDSLERTIGRLEGKVDMILAGQTVTTVALASHDIRISKVERWQNAALGGAAVVGFGLGIVARILV